MPAFRGVVQNRYLHDIRNQLPNPAFGIRRIPRGIDANPQAVFSGHLAAREFDEVIDPDVTPFKVER